MRNKLARNAGTVRKICANCKYAAWFTAPYTAPSGLKIYGYCHRYGAPRPIQQRGFRCISHALCGRQTLTGIQMAAVILHTLRTWDGWGETRLTRLTEHARVTLEDMAGGEFSRGFAPDDLVGEYEKYGLKHIEED